MTPNHHEMGVGATEGLSLRVSVGVLVRLFFEHPKDNKVMLALERKATFLESESGHVVDIKSQPFGGAIQLLDPSALQNHIDHFHFDSEGSRAEQDFRIFIRPSQWEAVREFCLVHLNLPNDPVLESDPARELTEEFVDTLGVRLSPDQYRYQAMGIIIEDHPSPTENIRARGYPTARVYSIFEARILDPSLTIAMLENSKNCSDQDLRERALGDVRNGGYGRANAVLALPLQELTAFYLAIPFEARNRPIWFQGRQLDETVAAVLDGVTVPKYRNEARKNSSLT